VDVDVDVVVDLVADVVVLGLPVGRGHQVSGHTLELHRASVAEVRV